MRRLYTLLLYLLTPLVLLRLMWRGLRAPAYLRRWPERFGYFPVPPAAGVIWIHAVSVGEVQAAAPLVRALRERYPGVPLLLTTTTPTGSDRAREAFGRDVVHVYAPYDLPGAVRRFLVRVRPRLAVVMETELWPNLFHACREAGVPLVVANARLSPRSAAGYRRVASLTRRTLANVSVIAAQSRRDADDLISIGADPQRVQVTGNVKFDVRLPASLHEQAQVLRRAWGAARPVWIAASTHEGEEERVLDAFERVRQALPDVLLVLVPRHPERFSRVAALCRRRGYATRLRSERRACTPDTAVFLGDSMGELSLFYAASDVAFVGGSLVSAGGHNLLEPAALGLPVIFGPHVFNFEEISRLLLEQGAARRVRDAEELAGVVEQLLRDANLRHSAGEQGRQAVERNRGAVDRVMQMLAGYVEREV